MCVLELIDEMLDSLNKTIKVPETIFCPSCFISDFFGKIDKLFLFTYYMHLQLIF